MGELNYQVDLLTAMNEKLRSTEEMYRLICNSSSDAFLYCNLAEGKYETAGCFSSLFSFAVERESDLELLLQEMQPQSQAKLRELLYWNKIGEECYLECQRQDKKRWLEFKANVAVDEKNEPIARIICIRDIDKVKKQRDELTYMAYYDLLTDLYNRNYFIRILREWINRARENLNVISIMCINIDDFKRYNDGFGMIIGDEILQGFGLFLKKFQKENVLVAHTGGDEFYIAIYDPFGTDCVDYIYEEIQRHLKEPFVTTNNLKISFTVSVGVVQFPEAGKEVLELLNSAEVVMFHARERGRNHIAYYESPILSDFLEHFSMEDKLKEAIKQNEFVLYFQPQYDVRTNKLRGAEALIRWRAKDGAVINPGRFIPVAEQSGMIVEIGEWVVAEALRVLSEWKQKYDTDLIISINVSAIQYKQRNFTANLLHLMEKYHISPHDIELEITESVLIDDFDDVVDKMKTLKEYGIKISLDDFGTGYSSLSYLKGLPIDTLKIDKTFIDTVMVDKSSQVIIESIITMVKRLGCETVAEGVETEEQYEYLRKVDCDSIQGYLLGKPMPAETMEELLIKKSELC